jgi:hypothetical protein
MEKAFNKPRNADKICGSADRKHSVLRGIFKPNDISLQTYNNQQWAVCMARN